MFGGRGLVALASVAARVFGCRGMVAAVAAGLRSGMNTGGILPEVVSSSRHLVRCFIAASFELAAHEVGQSA